MATPILQVITEYCEMEVDDERLNVLKRTDMPLYARTMWQYLRAGVPLFTLPENMPLYLVGTPDSPMITAPQYDSTRYSVTSDLTADTVVSLGTDFTGYELFCCRQVVTDYFGNIQMLAVSNVTYDADAGTITIAASENSPIVAGTVYDMDFYTDGSFTNTLSSEIMSILAVCFKVKWLQRFSNDWLSLVPKIEDGSFKEQNRANKENADTERVESAMKELASRMKNFDVTIGNRKVFPSLPLF